MSVPVCTGLYTLHQSVSLCENQCFTDVSSNAMERQQMKLIQQSNNLQRHIKSWITLQHLFIPALAQACAYTWQNTENIMQSENFPLLLPSRMRCSIPCDENLYLMEWRLCFAQAHNILHFLHSNLCTCSYILKYKDQNLHGQGMNTRAWNTLKLVDAHIHQQSPGWLSSTVQHYGTMK